MSVQDTLTRWRYRYVPDHVLGELLSKNWIDNVIPFVMLVGSIAVFGSIVPGFFEPFTLSDSTRQLAEVGFVAMGMAIVMLAGGIDLSVGSVFAIGNFLTLALINLLGWPVFVTLPVVLAACAAIGLVNGLLIGFLRLRAFLTTLVTLIIFRSAADLLVLTYGTRLATGGASSPLWDYLAYGDVYGVPVSCLVVLVVAIILHVMLTRSRFGWHLLAVGGSRRSAHNAGIKVRRTVCLTYVLSSTLTGLGSFFYAARIGSAASDAGLGMEVLVLTAVVLGGNSLGGGRGSVAKALMGTVIVLTLTNSLISLGLQSGASTLVLAVALLIGVAIDVKWLKNRHKVISSVYVSPAYFSMPTCPPTDPDSGSPYAQNDRLKDVELIGLGELDGPEDVIFDRDDNLYTGSRHGDVIRFLAPDYKKRELFAHIGGQTLGFAFDRNDHLNVCVGGMGLYKVLPDGEVVRQTDETNRSLWSIIDDSRMRLADDLDIAPDGRIFFSEATIRYDIAEWATDSVETRGNGRIVCYDPRSGRTRTVLQNLVFPNGVCIANDGQSFFFAETWAARISRYWFDGPRKGKLEVVIPDLPGLPDNINRASDGTYWCALMGMRAPVVDMALRMPGFRRRMAMRVAHDEWMYPNINAGCIIRFDDNGTVLESYWDAGGVNHPQTTSMREHKGWLYIGGVHNNRIGRLRLPDADPNWTSNDSYWGARK